MNSRFRRLVVGLDLDPNTCAPTLGSAAAAQTALWVGVASGAHVTLLHSLAQSDYFDPLSNELIAICGTVTPEGRAQISELMASMRGEQVACETVDTAERPVVAIAREVQRQGADLVLLGKHDGRESDSARIGPIALAVLRDSTAPVWLVVPGRPIAPRVIVAASDLTATSDEAVASAAQLAALAKAELHVVHVHPPALHTRPGSKAEREARTRSAMLAPVPASQRDAVQLHLRESSPAQGVLELCEELEPDLVVFGALAHKNDKPGVLGSTAERLIGRSDCSLLVLRPT